MASESAYVSVPTHEGATESLLYREGSLPPPPFTRQRPNQKNINCVKSITVVVFTLSVIGIAVTVMLALYPSILEKYISHDTGEQTQQDFNQDHSDFFNKEFFDNSANSNKITSSVPFPTTSSLSPSTTSPTTTTTPAPTTTTTPPPPTTTPTTTPPPTTTTPTTTPLPTTTPPPTTTPVPVDSSSESSNPVEPELTSPCCGDDDAEQQDDFSGYDIMAVDQKDVPLSLLAVILILGIVVTLAVLAGIVWAIKRRTRKLRRQQHVRNVINELGEQDKANLLHEDDEMDA